MKCAVVNCNSKNYGKNCERSFFRFPNPNGPTFKKWVDFCGQKKKAITKSSYVCMLHFKPDDFDNNIKFEMGFATRRLLKPCAVPSVSVKIIENIELYEKRASRIEKREQKKIVASLLKESAEELPPQPTEEVIIKDEAQQFDIEEYQTVPEFLDDYVDEIVGQSRNENVSPFFSGQEDYFDSLRTELQMCRKENSVLKKQNKKNGIELRAMKRQMAKVNFELKNLEDTLGTIFTSGHISKLKTGIKRPTWAESDIKQCMLLYTASPNLYKLLYRKKFPIAAVRTLQQWVKSNKLKWGDVIFQQSNNEVEVEENVEIEEDVEIEEEVKTENT